MPSRQPFISRVSIFKDLPEDALQALESRLQPVRISRGDLVVREGEEADALFIIVSGRFTVEVNGHAGIITEIVRGSTIGEIAFFAGGKRTATVRAIRDGIVVRLTRADFDEISKHSPEAWSAITSVLAERLAEETRRNTHNRMAAVVARARPRPRTIAIVGATSGQIDRSFLSAFTEAASRRSGTLVLSSATVTEVLGAPFQDNLDVTEALNGLESRFDTVVFIADEGRTPWSEKCIRQADELLLIASAPNDPIVSTVALGDLERFAQCVHPPGTRRLVLVHARQGSPEGTRYWLALRQPAMHHHVLGGCEADIARLWRFIAGEALGFVACGGGAYCSAHIGVYSAFRETGIDFDIYGGTSGGAAMAAAFVQDLDPHAIASGVHRMFVEGRALSRYTLPKYSLLDHAHFDDHLKREYGAVRIEDLWKPYFAVSTDLSNYEMEIHRQGPLWEAIRASAAIPGLLPPYYTADGRMLVDGSVISNVPIEAMHALKRGPNVVVSFQSGGTEKFSVDYTSLPRRNELIWRSLNPFSSSTLPVAPSAATVLIRSLMANRGHFERYLEAEDWLLVPPTPPGMGALDWRRHSEVMNAAYDYTRRQIAQNDGINLARFET
ncbi:patatin-like phospholipase family protein [Hyphomicrobium sp.]|uniref:patatin-like phospholipase family protein n=1 Tax=Hyphomicrobium sp. TaxID=82 RepID=UPI000FC0987D|nr:patatin-like phospholipase family protein [Hyphomicrobium sp.]RUO99072.1 MAG: cyclic nucleotide-binding domain-containing protein [Hyphomicrobium sp.]